MRVEQRSGEKSLRKSQLENWARVSFGFFSWQDERKSNKLVETTRFTCYKNENSTTKTEITKKNDIIEEEFYYFEIVDSLSNITIHA